MAIVGFTIFIWSNHFVYPIHCFLFSVYLTCGQAPGDAGNAPGASRGVAEDVGEHRGRLNHLDDGDRTPQNSWDFIVI